MSPQQVDDLDDELVLKPEELTPRPLEDFALDLGAGGRVDQLDDDPHAVAGALDAPLHQAAGSEHAHQAVERSLSISKRLHTEDRNHVQLLDLAHL